MPCILIARFISQVLFAFFCLLKGGAYHTASYKLEMVIVGSSFLNGISVPGPPPKTQTQTHTHTHTVKNRVLWLHRAHLKEKVIVGVIMTLAGCCGC